MSFRHFLINLFEPRSPNAMAASTPSDAPHVANIGHYDIRDATYAAAFHDWFNNRASVSLARMQALSPSAAIENLEQRSGYIREFSLHVLSTQNYAESIRHVIHRLNDYVTANRSISLQLVLRWLAELPFTSVVNVLPDLYALEHQSRADFQQVSKAILTRLAEPGSRDLLLAGVNHERAKVRAHCWRLCLQAFEWTDFEKVKHAIESSDAMVARLVEPIVYTLADSELQEILRRPQLLKAMALRRAAYVSAWRKKLVDMDALVVLALWDHSFSIRWLARHWCKDRPGLLVTLYRRMLAEPNSLRLQRYALEGLAQLRIPETQDCCQEAWRSVHPALRKAALEALCAIEPEKRHAYLVEALSDATADVVRKSFELSLKTGDHLAYEELLPFAQSRNGDLDLLVRLIDYASHVSVWLGLHLASLSRNANPDVQTSLKPYVDAFLTTWALRQFYVAPSPKQWFDICAWLPYESLDQRSALRFALEGQAKRMKIQG